MGQSAQAERHPHAPTRTPLTHTANSQVRHPQRARACAPHRHRTAVQLTLLPLLLPAAAAALQPAALMYVL